MTTTARSEIPKAYDPKAVEGRWYRFWEEGGYFTPKIDPQRKPFVIIMPPPNVTGELHLGHALVVTIEDILTRWHRMLGDPTLWLPGTDHASIAAQWVMEQELAKEGVTRQALGRERFLERMWELMNKYRPIIDDQHRSLGASCDWTRNRFTMDPGPSRAVRTTFTNLFHKGLIYRGLRLINWCPRCTTALSDLEVEHEELESHLWYIRYPLAKESEGSEQEYITVATTRPETILGDTAVAVSPLDQRHKRIVGRKAVLPVLGREIPIIADEAVDPAFGTGAVKITPAHDPVDFEVSQRHHLPQINILNHDATMNEEAGPYVGMDRSVCREAIVKDLEREGLLVRIEPYHHSVGHCYRCHTVVEPYLSEQWFMNVRPLAARAIQAVADGRITMVPERFTKVYYNWMENIRDWCISRQLWWGHRIPVWYCGGCHGDKINLVFREPLADAEGEDWASGTYAALRKVGIPHEEILAQADRITVSSGAEPIVQVDPPASCPRCGSRYLLQDPDVLDTWFSSGLWPHTTLGWPEDTEDLRYFYPTTVMETAYDILFFWVARMIMMGLENTGDIPFRIVYLHGLIRDAQGDKMSKSKGNVVNPLDVMEKYGTDALRFTLIAGSSPGNDMRLNPQRVEASRNFANKLWNATRFVISTLPQGQPLKDWERPDSADNTDRWILSRLNRLVETVNQLMEDFQLGEAGRQIHDFLWGEYCDWYIELAKVRLREANAAPFLVPVLAHVLETSLRLLHPFMPFLTEELWQALRPRLSGSTDMSPALIITPYPKEDRGLRHEDAEREMELVTQVIRSIRNARAERKVEPARRITAWVYGTEAVLNELTQHEEGIKTLARLSTLELRSDKERRPESQEAVPLVLERCEIYLPLAGIVDLGAERERLAKELASEEREVARLEVKLAQSDFTAKAPAPVVEKERGKLAATRERAERLRTRLAALGG